MPVEPMSSDTPSTRPPYADTLGPNRAPALNATSDRPIIIDVNGPQAGDEVEPVDTGAKPDKTDGTSGDKPEGEGDGSPQPKPGEETDQTSPQQRAAFARERNRRQAAEQANAELKAKADQLIEIVSKLVPKEEPKADPRPTRDAFDDPGAYDKALEDWSRKDATEKATAEANAKQAREQVARQTETVVNTFKERVTAFEADHPDFDDVVYQEDVKISPPMSQAILEAEDGPAIAYWLGNNPEAAERISKLSPASAVVEIGRISTRLQAPPPKPKPEPIRPIGTRNNAGPKSPDEMSMDEYAQVSPNRRKTN